MREHPIEGLMLTAMNSIRDMVDVNTIIGETIETDSGTLIIPVSKVGFGFAAGGSEFTVEALNEYTRRNNDEQVQYKLPFGGGSGAGVSISPIAFLVVQGESVKLLHVDNDSPIDKLLDYVPDLVDKIGNVLEEKMSKVSQNNESNTEVKNELDTKKEKKNNKEKNIEIFDDEIGKIK
ncbi:MAG: GerW family sporulation protein [Clostridia bacterium]|nr:GerW family sporulation protein [Clostridia bacterium]